jgi:tetratricopeptide (TPR) repeat protein
VFAPPVPAIALVVPGFPNPRLTARTPAQPNPEQAKQFVTLGKRLFRAGNLKRSEERFKQSARSEPKAAAPWVGLAQIAIVRGNYSEAAAHFRRAQAAQPNWLINAPDVEASYAEPSDFGAAISRLETRLQAHPNDRDAWLVLGAQMYLSGRTRKAADIFERLNDRQPDATLAAFLEATQPNAGMPR